MPIKKLTERRVNAELLKMGPKTPQNSGSTADPFETSYDASQKNYNKRNR